MLGLDVHDTIVKGGLDYGGECLKICLLLLPKHQIDMINEPETSAKAIKKMRMNSVKKVVIIGAADVKECYHNIKLLWSQLDMNSMKLQMAIDLKMTNITLGLQVI